MILPLSYHIKTVFNTLHLQDLFCIILFSFIFEDFPKIKGRYSWFRGNLGSSSKNIKEKWWASRLSKREERRVKQEEKLGGNTYHFYSSPSTGPAWLSSGPWRTFSALNFTAVFNSLTLCSDLWTFSLSIIHSWVARQPSVSQQETLSWVGSRQPIGWCGASIGCSYWWAYLVWYGRRRNQ